MSAAGRGERLGGDLDVYPTPAWCVERLLEAWRPKDSCIVEPCVGDGALCRAVESILGPQNWVTYDVRAVCRNPRWTPHLLDFTRLDPADWGSDLVSTVLTNPPFTLAEAFLRQARELYPAAELVMLLRIGFLCAEERRPFYELFGTPDLFFLPNRPSFTRGQGRKGTDSSEYAWFRFPAERQETGTVTVLASTPKAIRCPAIRRGAA